MAKIYKRYKSSLFFSKDEGEDKEKKRLAQPMAMRVGEEKYYEFGEVGEVANIKVYDYDATSYKKLNSIPVCWESDCKNCLKQKKHKENQEQKPEEKQQERELEKHDQDGINLQECCNKDEAHTCLTSTTSMGTSETFPSPSSLSPQPNTTSATSPTTSSSSDNGRSTMEAQNEDQDEDEDDEEPMDLSNISRHVQSYSVSSSDDFSANESLSQNRESHSSENGSPLSARSSSPEPMTDGAQPRRLYKDERRARDEGLDAFIDVDTIINSDMQELKDQLNQMKNVGITDHQIAVAMDIRKRGKNKKAARHCRTKKQVEIDTLKEKVTEARAIQSRNEEKTQQLLDELLKEESKLSKLCRLVTQQANKDPDIFEITLNNDNEVRFRLRKAGEGEQEDRRRREQKVESRNIWRITP